MPSVDGSKNILTSAAGYQAGDWASVGAQGSLDFQATADFSRGFDVQLGAEAIVRLDGAIREYLAADVTGQAHAAARVRAQVQVPLDLFNEAGLAVRLQAVAEASAGVTLAIGLQVGDFLRLAGADDRMRGVPLELLKAFLAEFTIQGGVMAKVSAAAMAYANLSLTGRLIPQGTQKPGFTIAAEAGAGLKAGAGFRVLAAFGVDDPRRWIRRTIDVAVDESVKTLRPVLPNHASPVLDQLVVPAKIAMRTAFEIGSALTENGGAFAPGDGPKLALRCVQVALEEVQRHLLEQAVALALDAIERELRGLGNVDLQRWQAAQPQRRALANALLAMPEYRLEATPENLTYWIGIVEKVSQVALAMAPTNAVPQEVVRPLAILWCAVQLGSIALKRITDGQARVAMLGHPVAQAVTPFQGNLAPPPAFIGAHLNAVLGRPANSAVAQTQAVDFLVRSLVAELDRLGPGLTDAVRLVIGSRTGSLSEALSLVLTNLGAFVPDASGTVNATTTLVVIRDALRTFFDGRVEADLRPALLEVASDSRVTALFADEVLLGAFRTTVHVLFDRVLSWDSGTAITQKTVRELCSALILSLAGRSLVVCGDVLLVKALESVQGEFRQVASRIDDPAGVAEKLAGLTGLDRGFVAEVVEEALLVCADAFEPMPEERRARLRNLLYETIEAGAGLSLAELERKDFVPNQSSAQELALLLGEEIAGNIARFIQAFLTRVGGLILEALRDLIEDLQQAVGEWVASLVGLVQELGQRIAELVAEIERFGQEVDVAADALLGSLSSLLNRLGNHQGSRSSLRTVVRDLVVDEALAVLRSLGVYQNLPRGLKTLARSELRSAAGAVLDTGVFDFVLEAFASIGHEAADFLEDIRAIEPGDDIEQAVLELFLDRLEDATDDAFGGQDPGVNIGFDVGSIHISIGRVSIPLSGIITGIRQKARTFQGIKNRVRDVAEQLLVLFQHEANLAAAEAEDIIVRGEEARGQAQVAESRRGPPIVEVVRPAAGAAMHGEVELEIVIRNVTQAILDVAPPGQPRVFLWLNQRLLALDGAGVQEFGQRPARMVDLTNAEPIIGTATARIATQAIGRDVRGGALIRDGRDRERRGGGKEVPTPMLTRKRGAPRGQSTRLGGRGVPPPPFAGSPLGLGRNVRPTDIRGGADAGVPGIRISLRIPLDLLAEGINTVTVVVMPGSAEQRVEQTVSFLWRPISRFDGPLAAPGRLILDGDKLPNFTRDAVSRRLGKAGKAGGVTPEFAAPHSEAAFRSWGRAADRDGREHEAWFPTRAVRAEATRATRAELMERMGVSVREISKLREAVRSKALRARETPLRTGRETGTRKGEGHGHAS